MLPCSQVLRTQVRSPSRITIFVRFFLLLVGGTVPTVLNAWCSSRWEDSKQRYAPYLFAEPLYLPHVSRCEALFLCPDAAVSTRVCSSHVLRIPRGGRGVEGSNPMHLLAVETSCTLECHFAREAMC